MRSGDTNARCGKALRCPEPGCPTLIHSTPGSFQELERMMWHYRKRHGRRLTVLEAKAIRSEHERYHDDTDARERNDRGYRNALRGVV